MEIARVLDAIASDPQYRGQIVHREQFPARTARFGTQDPALPADLASALGRLGVRRLYTHQAEVLEAVRRGASVIVTTGTASGKTLCYALPVLEALLADPATRALFIYPTKALAQDQMDALAGFGLPVPLGTYDGDTPQETRRRLRADARILLTNPDMLHVGILPQHARWTGFLRSLRYVVLDDMHVYRGVFGSHVALILRRLRRVARLRGADPQFICTSATIANPEEFGSRLTGVPLHPVSSDGAPRGPRQFVLWNPPVVDRAKMTRRSPYLEASRLFTAFLRHGLRTIVFTKARKITELIYRYAVEGLADAPELAGRVRPYRAGYLPHERREIEQRLFDGELAGVVSTSALELGIDVGGLDAAILVGYPGTMASVWQRAGRAGRGAGESVAVLVALGDALDQYLMRQPAYFFGRPVECAAVNPDNPYVLAGHLRCAASEIALWPGDEPAFGPGMRDVARALEGLGALVRRGDRWYAPRRAYPAGAVDIRAASGDIYRIVRAGTRGVLGTVDAMRAFEQLHEGAIYLHQGESYRVTRLDVDARAAFVEPDARGYYTEARVLTDLAVERTSAAAPIGPAQAQFGDVRVSQQAVEYRRKQLVTDTVLGVEPLDMPEQELRTAALWVVLPDALVSAVERAGLDLAGGIHAVEHAAIGLLPLLAMCDRWDIGGVSYPVHPQTGRATIFIYDGYPGSVGIAEQGFRQLEALLRRTLEAIAACPCEAGCPSCIQSPKCGSLNTPLDKSAAIFLLRRLTCTGPPARPNVSASRRARGGR
jgi:DEAD/DEAH box helicase domain-containing protein